MPRRPRRWITMAAVGVLVVAALAFAVPYIYANYIADDAPAPLALETPAEGTAEPGGGSGGSGGGSGTAPESLDGTWTVTDESEAGYRVDEVLNGQDVTVVGRTADVTGEVVVSGGSVESGEVVVDMTTVTTDSSSRDGQFQGMIMNTARYPTSTFALTAPVDLGDMDAGTQVAVTTTGELTILDTTREVEADLTLQRSGETVQVAGAVPITFADFGVVAPDLGFVKVEESGTVEFLLTLTQG